MEGTMTKYIDAEKLIAEIERKIGICEQQRADAIKVECYNLADDASARMGELRVLLETITSLQQEQPEGGLVEEIKVVYPDNPKRKEIGFYYSKKEVSWEDMLLADRMHDYPYYFRDGMDYYPFIPEQKPTKKNNIGYELGR